MKRTIELTNEEAIIVILALEAYSPQYPATTEHQVNMRRRDRNTALDLASRVRVAT